ncbi:PaaI family thioesterase [Pendulispora rubella]|uniref:PaaI family thioesterase n=1 Tax=Pendulispora rubella TaxID=2741070 RepID=A0ABZ2L704_9BACT
MEGLHDKVRRPGVVTNEVLLAETGLTFVRGVMDGHHPFPPVLDMLECDLVEVEEGRVVFTSRPTPRFLNPIGTIQGGWAATVLDAAMAFAIHSTLKRGEGYTTLEMKLNYVRPVLPSSGIVRGEGQLIHRGSRIATAEGRLLDAGGKLLAHGGETCMIFPAKTA